MGFYEYWIGKDIDYDEIWRVFDEGQGYIEKFKHMEVYFVRFTFDKYSSNLPLFDNEAIYKTIKGLYHDVKKECLTDKEYNEYGPIFLYGVDRGSGIYEFLGELKPVLLLSIPLTLYKIVSMDLNNIDKKISIIKNHFPNATNLDIEEFIKAWTFLGRKKVITRLLREQKLKKIEISKTPFKKKKVDLNFLEITDIFKE
jgi:hypothetical protein